MHRRYFPKSTEELLHWYERYVSPLALVAGFLVDNFFLLARVDVLQTHIVFLIYLVLIALCIILIHLIGVGRISNPLAVSASPFIPVVIQFAFGNLFSGFLSLYSRSASLAVSWIIVFVLVVLLLGNERFARSYTRVPFQLSMYFGVLFSFLIFFIPVMLHAVGPLIFLMSGVVSLCIITLFLFLLNKNIPERIAPALKTTVVSIAGIFVFLNGAYFLNLLPPLPLSLKSAGVYHRIVRQDDGAYLLSGEPRAWYQAYLRYNTIYHKVEGEPIYVFTSVFAPTDLSVGIIHEWQRYDVTLGEWSTFNTVAFQIAGGREGGYRGYSVAYAPVDGDWRVNVRTNYGQLIGRVNFTIISASSTPPLSVKVQ